MHLQLSAKTPVFIAFLIAALRAIAGVAIAISGDAPKTREDWSPASFAAILVNSCHLGVITVEGDLELGVLGNT